ncbi:malto-oligosyltrehalose synthase, partial [Roseisolibacter sp. H3M3-2]|uniref:malto-oligosyltrehalose synthase n=1 Tax=Roseisolibacter sp. H3M3-2 TaxID=3031323 RepID=UPI0023D9DA3C
MAEQPVDPRPLAGPPFTATYRLQLNADFGFDAARALVPYLARLGVSHLYLSPVLQARPGSTHGYDTVDPRCANPELGGDAGFAALADAAHAHGLGVLVDIVPNHMGAGPANPYWLDVLALGRESQYARWFDVDWDAPHARGRLVLPVLGDDPEAVLARGELKPALHGDRFAIRYFDHVFPLDPRTVHRLFAFSHTYLFPPSAREESEAWARVRDALVPAGGASPSAAEATASVRAAAELASRSEAVRAYVEWVLDVFAAGDDGRFRLQALLDLQRWRLAHWQETRRELHFRRFFDVTELVAVRVEDPEVFAGYHEWLLDRVGEGRIDAVRVDHVDGLLDPRHYLFMLRDALDARRPDERVPIFVEKILSPDEALHAEWPVDGTTGYEALNEVERALVSPDGAATLERSYRRLLRARAEVTYAQVAARGKEHVLRSTFRPELRRLVSLLMRVGRALGVTATPASMSEALLQLAVALPVYRTYVRPDPDAPGHLRVDADDRARLESVVEALIARGVSRPEVVRLVADVLLGDVPGPVPVKAAQRRAAREVALRFQQVSGPATAKGIEDTALYRWFPVASLNEVGGEPAHPLGPAVDELHAAHAVRARVWPRSLVAATTHDTKRSADARARLDVLAEVAAELGALAARWQRRHAPLRALAARRLAPDANTEYLLYQTVVAVWPEGADAVDDALTTRVEEYLRKATREAKAQTSWVAPNAAFEHGTLLFARTLLRDEAGAPFRREMSALMRRVAPAGRWNALARVLIQGAAPGTPDVYRGDELWQHLLVDPDNRGPVDWAERKVSLLEIERGSPDAAALLASAADGRLKMHVLRATLLARRTGPALYGLGAHEPLPVGGPRGTHVVAFARAHAG